MANRVRQFEPPAAWVDAEGKLTDRAQWFLRDLFNYIGADSGQIPTDSLGGDGVSTDRFLREDGSFAVPNEAGTPSALVGVDPVVGSSSEFMPADSAPAIDQAMEPTWSELHVFNGGLEATAADISGNLTSGQFGCNGAAAQPSAAIPVAVGGSAGASYTATEQTMLNDLRQLVNAIRSALVSNGIAV